MGPPQEDLIHLKTKIFKKWGEVAQKSHDKRVELSKAWASSVKLQKRIHVAVQSHKVPSHKNVARWLKGQGLVTRRGGRWDGSNLHKQVNRLGWSWRELTKE